jgi:hypothetical protein
MLKSYSKWYLINPFDLKNERNQIMEDIWQFSRLYRYVPRSKQYKSRWDKTVIWDHPAEIHVDPGTDVINEKGKAWILKGLNNKEAVRYPATYEHRVNCIGVLPPALRLRLEAGEKDVVIKVSDLLNIPEGRKQVYIQEYTQLLIQHPLYKELQARLLKGENLLICEIDGPRQDSLQYYKDNYNVDDTFIENHTMLATEKNLDILLHDGKHSYGHGFCVARALLAASSCGQDVVAAGALL